ncbi:hypothetical protein D3C78_1034280 [compost metagenome]
MVAPRVLAGGDRLRIVMHGGHFLVALPEQEQVRIRRAQRGQARRLAFQQRAHLEQVVEGAWLGTEQVHQRRAVAAAIEVGHERAAALLGLDDPSPTQHAQPFAQRRTRAAEFLHQAPLGRQSLPLLQHTVDDQPLDPLRDLVGHPLSLVTTTAIYSHRHPILVGPVV